MAMIRMVGPQGALVVSVHGHLRATQPKPIFLFLEGWGPGMPRWISPSDRAARWLAGQADVLTATIFLTGIGSPGRVDGLTRADFLSEVLLAYDRLAAIPGVAGVRAVGTSFGGYLSLLLSAERPVQRLVLKVPTDVDPDGFATRPQTELAGELGLYWKAAAHTPSDSPAVAAAAAFDGPVWLISAGRDEVVPWQTTANYLAVLNPERTHHLHVPRAGHAMALHGRTFRGALAEAAQDARG